MYRKVTDARTLRGERELLQYRKSVRQHFGALEIWKPKTEIKWIGHNRLECSYAPRVRVRFDDSKLSWDRRKSVARSRPHFDRLAKDCYDQQVPRAPHRTTVPVV